MARPSSESFPPAPPRRTARLYEIIRILRDGRVHQAEALARRFRVSVRTLYRDMEVLTASGVAIEGTRGRGYRMTAPLTLPPLNLSYDELEALHLGLAVVGEAGDAAMRQAAERLAARIDAALPEDGGPPDGPGGLALRPFGDAAAGTRHVAAARAAIRSRQKLRIVIGGTARTVRPLKLEFWGRLWILTCWCEARGGFARERLDAIASLTVLPALFVDEPGKALSDLAKSEIGEAGADG